MTFSYFECMKSKHILNLLFERFSGTYINYFVIFITFTTHLSSDTTQHISLLHAIFFCIFYRSLCLTCDVYMYKPPPKSLLPRRIDFSPSVNCQYFFRYWRSLKNHSSIQNWNFDWFEIVRAVLLQVTIVL